MKREIEFRVWNGQKMEYNVMAGKFGVFFVNPECKGDGLNPNDTASLTPSNTKYPDGIEVMQFTGKTDKNGKQIFDGDICKDEGGRNLLVAWSDKYASWVLISDKWMFAHYFGEGANPEDVEVIGNIYENPELLK